uniref:(northern house mosquito) hypothetical protein n=1 Tax=Culex pipiens TaxID=7175 RepID=A0A8D8BZY9_CULPI
MVVRAGPPCPQRLIPGPRRSHRKEGQCPRQGRHQRVLALVVRVAKARIEDDVWHQLQTVQLLFFFDWLAALLVQHDARPQRQDDQSSHDDGDGRDPDACVKILRVHHDPPNQVFLLHVRRGGGRDGDDFAGTERVVRPDPELVRGVRDQVVDLQLARIRTNVPRVDRLPAFLRILFRHPEPSHFRRKVPDRVSAGPVWQHFPHQHRNNS